MLIVDHPSPNFNARRNRVLPDMIVLHHTVLDLPESLRRLCDPVIEVSAHFVIAADGAIFRLVPEQMRAWHAGAGRWGAVAEVNSRSVGIEIVNRGDHPYAAAQMRALEGLLPGIMVRWRVPPERVIAHSDMAPRRKIDPGKRFDWRRLALAGLAVWPFLGAGAGTGAGGGTGAGAGPAPAAPGGTGLRAGPARQATPARVAPDMGAFRAALSTIGYDPDIDDDLGLSAFRLRFRPWGAGALAAGDIAAAQDIAARFPVDQPQSGA